jgi:hypothetical protein
MPHISLVLMVLPKFRNHSIFSIPKWKGALALVLEEEEEELWVQREGPA